MTAFTVYDTTTGRVLRTGTAPLADIDGQAGTGEAMLLAEVIYPDDEFYIDISGTPAPTALETFAEEFDQTTIDADGVDEATMLLIPDGAEVKVGDSDWTDVVDGEVIVTATVPGDLIVSFRMPLPYRDFEVTISAV